MSEAGVEIPIQQESKPVLGKREYEYQGNRIKVGFAKFSNPENSNFDPKKAAFLLTGWPMRHDTQIDWGQSQALAKEFGLTTYDIDGRPKGVFKGSSIALEVEGIRQFTQELQSTGVEEITLFGHSIGASKIIDLAVSLEQKNSGLKINLVLINPMGLTDKDIKEIAKNYLLDASAVEDRTKNPNRIYQKNKFKVLMGLGKSLLKDVRDLKLRYPRLLTDQIRYLSQMNSNLAKIKSPVLVLLASEDPVSELERILPKQEVEKLMPAPKPEENSRESMARVSKARTDYLRKEVFPQAEHVGIIVVEKFANHIAFGIERPGATNHIIARYFARVEREAKKQQPV
ncbi:MAG: alpha/beta hydrolase [Candidatus Daviesbacteria bacterium]|nr:alpha/beta hydrolase [Candidatus Daviesbacteria bacterium]